MTIKSTARSGDKVREPMVHFVVLYIRRSNREGTHAANSWYGSAFTLAN